MANDKERFLAKVRKQEKGCWEWLGAGCGLGYGAFWLNGKRGYAHRSAFLLFAGAIPTGYEVHHQCHDRACVNPEHLQLLSVTENRSLQGPKKRGVGPHPYRRSQINPGSERGKLPKDPLERLMLKVERAPSGCWEWHGHLSPLGYGMFDWGKRRMPAHRAAYILTRGAVADELDIDHLCRNRGCVNPDHLEPVSHRENVLRGVSIVATQARQTHCHHGHLLEGANLLPSLKGHRRCRTCHNENGRRAKRIRREREKQIAIAAGTYQSKPGPRPKSHCRRGHPYTADNSYITTTGVRHCRECRRAADRQHYAKSHSP